MTSLHPPLPQWATERGYTPGAARAVIAAAKRKAATPPVIARLLEEGKRQRAELEAQGRDAAAVARIQATVERKLAAIGYVHDAALRARKLGALADWLSDPETREILDRTAAVTKPRTYHHQRQIPSWVPDYMVEGYRAKAKHDGEIAAAHWARGLKHEAEAEA